MKSYQTEKINDIADESDHAVPFYPAYWVIPGKFMAGCYPGAENETQAQKRLKGLIDHGISHIVDLMEADEMAWRGKAHWAYAERFMAWGKSLGKNLKIERAEIRDGWIPSKEKMKQTLDHIDRAILEGRPVYVHCWAGRGRTGTVVGCYLARHGYARGTGVLTMIHRIRRHAGDSWPSPENPRQCGFVCSWGQGE